MVRQENFSLSADCTDLLLKNLLGLFGNASTGDVILECQGNGQEEGEKVFVNSLIFALWCRPLYAAIQQKLKAGEWPCRLVCKDKPASVLKMVLRFMYTGRCTVDASNVMHLLSFATKWNIKHLQALCEDFKVQSGSAAESDAESFPPAQPLPSPPTPPSHLGSPSSNNSGPRPIRTPEVHATPPREPFSPISPNTPVQTPTEKEAIARIGRPMESGTRQRARSLRKAHGSCSTIAARYREPGSRIELSAPKDCSVDDIGVTVISTYSESDSVLPPSPSASVTQGKSAGQMTVVQSQFSKFVPGRRYVGYSAEAFLAVDAHALSAPTSAKASLTTLASYLMQAPTRDRDLYKLRVIFRWMCNNITHGGESNYHNCSPLNVLATGVTSCVGFVNFFTQMADKCGMGDKVVSVEGYCKGREYTLPFIIEEANHAWVMVMVENEWYLCDPTWAAGGYDSHGQFDGDFDDFWFFTPPELFAYTHFPRDPQMLLLPPTSRFDFKVFKTTPCLHSQFFKLGLRLGTVVDAVLKAETETLTFDWECASTPPAILPKLYSWSAPSSAIENCTLVQHGQSSKSNTRKIRFCITLPKPGAYKLELFAKPPGAEGTYKPLLWGYRLQRTGVQAVAPRLLPLRYPELYEPYNTAGAWVLSPAAAYVSHSQPTDWCVSLSMMADQVEAAIIRSHHRWVELKRDKSGRPFFTASFAPGCLPVEVLVTHKGDEKSVRTVLRYGTRPLPGTPCVYLSPRCAQYGVTVDIDPRIMKEAVPPYNPSAIRFRCFDNVQLALVLEDSAGLELDDRILQLGTSENFQLKVSGPKVGLYTLKVFAANQEQSQSLGVCSLPLQLDVTHIGPALVRQTGPCTVLEPILRNLKSTGRTTFRIQIPGALVVVLVNAGRRLFLESGGDDIWTGEFSLQPCPCTMLGASTDPADTSLAILLKYVVK